MQDRHLPLFETPITHRTFKDYLPGAAGIARRVAVAIIAPIVALILTLTVSPVAQKSPFLLFIVAVMVSAWFGGNRAGFLACLVSLAAHYLFIYPAPAQALNDLGYLVVLAVFIVVSFLISSLTARRRNQARVAERQAALIDLSSDGILTRRLDGTITFWSRGAEAMYGWTRLEALGKRTHELLQTEFPEPLQVVESKLARDGKWQGDLVHTRKDGTRLAVASRWLLQRGGGETPRMILETNTDITDRKRAEVEREDLLRREQAARAEVEQAVRIRDQFITIASHELKTPLTSIRGYADLLVQRGEQSHLDEEFQRMSRTVSIQSERLDKMITALLDISRVERGQLQLERGPVDLAALTCSLVDNTRPTLRRHNLELTGTTEELIVDGDVARLEQVLQNLLQNAVKYSPSGGPISVHLERENGKARVMVSDKGIGIPAADLPRLFSRFHRASNVEAFHIGGLGVGLYVVKEIVRLHGGDISVTSAEGSGSTFAVELPLAEGIQEREQMD